MSPSDAPGRGETGPVRPTAGERLFARYAHTPNALGYCGPATAAGLQAVACGGGAGVDLPRLARQFSGAWPYQQLIGELLGLDPLSEQVGRAYWTGSELTDQVDPRRLGELLLDRFAGQAGAYWTHLTADLLDEVTPTHAFHVLGVYPWSRLLATGRPEPLHVLDSCRIRAAEVVQAEPDGALVRVDRLGWDGHRLTVQPPGLERVGRRTPDGVFTGELSAGDLVAVHWGFLVDELTRPQAEQLVGRTARQVELTNRRLAR